MSRRRPSLWTLDPVSLDAESRVGPAPKQCAGLGSQDSRGIGHAFAVVNAPTQGFGRRLELSQEHRQDQRIDWRFHESVMAVEARRFLILGIDEKNPDSY